jgi:hypothetical protein
MSKINVFPSPNRARRRSISSQYVRSLTRTENTKRQSVSLRPLDPISSRATHTAADRRSCPSPATPTLAACRRNTASSSSAQFLAAATSPGSQSRIFAYPRNWPAGRRRGRRAPVRLASGFALPSILSAVGAAARPRHQGPLLAIPVHRPPTRSPSRVSSGTPPAYSRGLPTAGRSPWTRP